MRYPIIATVPLLLGALVGAGCHRDSIRFPEVVPATETGPRTTSVEGQPKPRTVAAEPESKATAVNREDVPATPPTKVTLAPTSPPTPSAAAATEATIVELPILTADRTPPEPEPKARAENGPPSGIGFVSKHSGTPLLDAAVARANGVVKAAVSETEAYPEESPTELPAASLKTTPNTPSIAAREETLATPRAETDEAATTELVLASPEPLPVSLPELSSAKSAKPIDPEKPSVKVGRPADPWRDTLDRLRGLARARAEKQGDGSEIWGLRARLLDWIEAGGTSPEQSEVLSRLLAALAPDSDAEPPDEAAAAGQFRETIDALEALGPLLVADLQLCRKVQGFGSFERFDPSSLRAGRSLILYCEMAGLRYEPIEAGLRSRLSSRLEVVAKATGETVWTHDLGTSEDVCRRRRRDYYVNYRLTLPSKLPPGSYQVRLIQTDLVADQSTSGSVDLELRP